MKEIKIEKLNRKEAGLLDLAFKKAFAEDFTYYPKIASQKFLTVWNEKYFRKNKPVIVVAKSADQIVGFIIGTPQWAGSGLGILSWVWVDKKFRHQGICELMVGLIEKLFILSGHHKLEVSADNPKTWDLYDKLGFNQKFFMKNHAWHNDEYLYAKELGAVK